MPSRPIEYHETWRVLEMLYRVDLHKQSPCSLDSLLVPWRMWAQHNCASRLSSPVSLQANSWILDCRGGCASTPVSSPHGRHAHVYVRTSCLVCCRCFQKYIGRQGFCCAVGGFSVRGTLGLSNGLRGNPLRLSFEFRCKLNHPWLSLIRAILTNGHQLSLIKSPTFLQSLFLVRRCSWHRLALALQGLQTTNSNTD